MTTTVNFLSARNNTSELRTIFRQLALLWKFELRELPQDDIVLPLKDSSILVIDLGSGSFDYQELVIRYLKSPAKRCLLFAGKSVYLRPHLKELTGVTAIVCSKYEKDLVVIKLANDPILNGTNGGGVTNLHWFNGCTVGNINTAEAFILLRTENNINLLTRSG